jgi:uncharacterized protein (UPF0332 family)
MSPRSAEFMAQARERLAGARALLERSLLGSAVSEAYYAILYAARAALSERDENAKTHSGTWSLFHQRFVAPGTFDAELARAARGTQESREAVDYAAASVSADEAARIVGLAERFVAAVASLLDAPD